MKKTILIVLVLALLAPVAAFGATEFSLGGYIKLDMFWDSTQTSKNNLGRIARDNDALFQHGHFNMTSQATRLNFTIKGPKLWGATTTGFVEIDFDAVSDPAVSATGTAYSPRLRHAMFRLNWPETELLMGMYWGFLAEYGPETTGDADLQFNGWINNRVPQIRLTQKFAGDWTVSGMIAKPFDPSTADVNFSGTLPAASFGSQLGLEGQSSETPQLQGKIAYEKDLYGKAPFYGRPRGFTAQVSAAWQRTRYRNNYSSGAANLAGGVNMNTFGQNAFGVTNVMQTSQQYLDPWIVQGTLFIPVIPTHSANLAGTASLLAQYWIGQGTDAFGAGPNEDNGYFVFQGIRPAGPGFFPQNQYERTLMNQFGGFVQGQYYFTNQWFLNAVWGFRKDYGIPQDRAFTTTGLNYIYASNNDQTKMNQEFDLTLWYRPIEAIKFGLQYSYTRTNWLQKLNNPVPVPPGIQSGVGASPQNSFGAKDVGEAHRIQFVAFMFF